MVLMAIFETVDDTKLVGKAVLGELAECLAKVMQDKYGLRVVKYLFAGRESAYTYPDAIEIMKKVILKHKERKERGEQLFSQVLLDTVDNAGLEAWVSCNRGAFLLLHCWETGVEEVQTKVKDLVTPLIATLRRQAKSKSKGAELLLLKITN